MNVTTFLWRHSFLTDPNENCTVYVKLKRKDILFNFSIFGIFIEKIKTNYDNHVYCPVTLHFSHHLWAAQ